jgi:hypothetical protein
MVGFGLAFIFLLIATLTRDSTRTRTALYVLAGLALVAQGGCWSMLVGISGAFSSYDGPDPWLIVLCAAGAELVWAFILEWQAQRRWAKKNLRKNERRDQI